MVESKVQQIKLLRSVKGATKEPFTKTKSREFFRIFRSDNHIDQIKLMDSLTDKTTRVTVNKKLKYFKFFQRQILRVWAKSESVGLSWELDDTEHTT